MQMGGGWLDAVYSRAGDSLLGPRGAPGLRTPPIDSSAWRQTRKLLTPFDPPLTARAANFLCMRRPERVYVWLCCVCVRKRMCCFLFFSFALSATLHSRDRTRFFYCARATCLFMHCSLSKGLCVPGGVVKRSHYYVGGGPRTVSGRCSSSSVAFAGGLEEDACCCFWFGPL
jgi:hypothetical protein